MLSLLIGIDTESDNQWDVRARANPTFENIYQLPRLHDLLVRRGVRPTYLVTYPVATDTRSVATLRGLTAGGDCEIGAHHHAWETPPLAPDEVRRHPYALSLPIERFEQQLTQLTAAIAVAVGTRPVSYRSGRFGFTARHVAPLERAGYRVESSVAPLFAERHKGGPDFVAAPLRPYFLAYDDPCTPGSSDVLEVPVSAALNRVVPETLRQAYGRMPRPYFMRRLLRAAGIARMVWLRPSYSSLEDMMALATRLAAAGEPVLNVLFHSSEALPDGSPYNRTETDVEAFLDRLDRFLVFATGQLGAQPATFSEFRDRYCAPAISPDGAASVSDRRRTARATRR
jgi:hypothetical protein